LEHKANVDVKDTFDSKHEVAEDVNRRALDGQKNMLGTSIYALRRRWMHSHQHSIFTIILGFLSHAHAAPYFPVA
jgi:hypothetical protein